MSNFLPSFLKDFHDQKDVFKLIEKCFVSKKRESDKEVDYPSWINAHIYTIDIFLAVMSLYGYKLQKTRKKGKYRDLEKDIAVMKDEEAEFLNTLISPDIP